MCYKKAALSMLVVVSTHLAMDQQAKQEKLHVTKELKDLPGRYNEFIESFKEASSDATRQQACLSFSTTIDKIWASHAYLTIPHTEDSVYDKQTLPDVKHKYEKLEIYLQKQLCHLKLKGQNPTHAYNKLVIDYIVGTEKLGDLDDFISYERAMQLARNLGARPVAHLPQLQKEETSAKREEFYVTLAKTRLNAARHILRWKCSVPVKNFKETSFISTSEQEQLRNALGLVSYITDDTKYVAPFCIEKAMDQYTYWKKHLDTLSETMSNL